MNNTEIKLQKINRIVMICTGNICRSPMAWGIGLREAEKRGLAVEIDSAGTGACDGYGASAHSLTACAEIGIDISMHIAKQVDISLYTPETLFVAMTVRHVNWLCAVEGISADNVVVLGVPDPYGQPLDAYRAARDSIEQSLCQLFDRIEPLIERKSGNDQDEAGLVIHPAMAADIDAVAAIEAECFTDPWSAESFAREQGNPASDFAAALLEGRVCGYAILYSAGGVSEIPKICVSPQYRRMGIASALLAWLEYKAVRRSSSELTLEVRESNAAARQLYEKCGFEFVGIRPNFYSNPHEDAAIMTKMLAPQYE